MIALGVVVAILGAVAAPATAGTSAAASSGIFASIGSFMAKFETVISLSLAVIDTTVNATADIISKKSATTIALDFLPLAFFGLGKGFQKIGAKLNELSKEMNKIGIVTQRNKYGFFEIVSINKKKLIGRFNDFFSKEMKDIVETGKQLSYNQISRFLESYTQNIREYSQNIAFFKHSKAIFKYRNSHAKAMLNTDKILEITQNLEKSYKEFNKTQQ
jgi:hypothetical protein